MTAAAELPLLTPAHLPVRHLPTPACEPPYDDELVPLGRTPDLVQGTLALSFVLPSGTPASPQHTPLLRLVGPDEQPPEDDDFGPQRSTSAALPPARSWAGRVVQAIVEVLAGVRPLGQLVRWTSEDVYDEIAHLVLPSSLAGCRSGEAGPPRGVVRSVHVTEPADGVAEVCALVRRGARSTAVALRLEGVDGRWRCTALELG